MLDIVDLLENILIGTQNMEMLSKISTLLGLIHSIPN
jgi:hypothetical protein